jgi:hypothetical protein
MEKWRMTPLCVKKHLEWARARWKAPSNKIAPRSICKKTLEHFPVPASETRALSLKVAQLACYRGNRAGAAIEWHRDRFAVPARLHAPTPAGRIPPESL